MKLTVNFKLNKISSNLEKIVQFLISINVEEYNESLLSDELMSLISENDQLASELKVVDWRSSVNSLIQDMKAMEEMKGEDSKYEIIRQTHAFYCSMISLVCTIG